MAKNAAAYDWLCRMEKHPTSIRVGQAIWWRWRMELSFEDIDTLPTPVGRRLPIGTHPLGQVWPTRFQALAAAAAAFTDAVKNGWTPDNILDPQ